jgi:hypothetical protein
MLEFVYLPLAFDLADLYLQQQVVVEDQDSAFESNASF